MMGWQELLISLAFKFGAILLALGIVVFVINVLAKNPLAKTVFDKEVLNAIKSDEGNHHIREQSLLAHVEGFKRVHERIDAVETKQTTFESDLKCQNQSFINLNEKFIAMAADIKYIAKSIDELINKK